MEKKSNQMKSKKNVITIITALLFVFVLGLITFLRPSVKNIKINKILTKTTSLSASVLDGISEGVASNNYDEIKYQIKVNKDKNDQAVIVGKLSNNENKYARFKEINEAEITDNGKTITISTKKSRVTVTVIVENAPYGTSINPDFTINSEDENKSKISVEPVTITGKSVEGKVLDEKGTLYNGLEVGLTKNGEILKKTYTKSDGDYVLSLGDVDSYELTLEEEKYRIVRFNEQTTDENRRIINIVIQEVEPFSLNIKKTINKLDLVVNGKKESFEYDNASTVVKSIKNAKSIEGSIYYNISIKNEGEIKGTLTALKDIIPDGLSFDEKKNPGWTKDGKSLFYTVLEDKEINPFEKLNVSLVLDIVKTDQAKNYLNKAIANGEDYKYVAYYLNNRIFKEEYVVANEKIENINPNVQNFGGWYTDREYSNKYNFNNAVTKDLILFGKINNNKYTVTFVDVNPNNNEETILDIKEINEGNSTDLVEAPEYRGYIFNCFELNDKCYDYEEIIEDTILYTKYEINNYEITYDLDDGSLEEENPETYTVNDEFTLNRPFKEGYTFTGWTGTDLTEEVLDLTISKGSIGDREYTANYVINKSTLTINPNGGTYLDNASSVSYTENYGTIKQISKSVRRGYTFKKYIHSGGGTYNNLSYTFNNDDGVLDAVYEINTYDITYNNITDEERNTLKNPVTYDVETDTFRIKNPSTRKDSYGNNSEDFVGWEDKNGVVSNVVTIEKGSIESKTYTAVWKENEDEYALRYILHDGVPSSPNPNIYKRGTSTFTLNKPSKIGYTFTGWTGTGLDSLTLNVTIPKGSSGDRTYEANYEVISYDITYNLNDGTVTSSNPTKYNIETNTITLNNPTKEGYEFIGWSGTGIADKSISVVIPKGSTGDRVYTAHFEKIEYTLSYTLNGGKLENGKTNPTKYSVESNDITLNNPNKAGYTFDGWSGTGLNGIIKQVTILHGSIGHRNFLANYTPIVYNLTYDYAGGSLEEGVTNPSTYTIESEDITLNNPTKEGYTFTNYTIDNVIATNIPTGSIGDKHLVANYEINHYTVKYYNGESLYSSDSIDWNTKTTKPVTNPTKAHHIFLYWSEDGVNEFDFNTLLHDNKNLYAVYEEVIAPEITIRPNLDLNTNRTWVCGNSNNDDCGVTVTISSSHSEYELYYKIGEGEATLYTEPFKVYENVTITAFSKKSNIYSISIDDSINNVDNIGPTINEPGTGAMSFNMTVSGTAQDAGSGVKKFTLYAKEKDALSFDQRYTYETEEFDGVKDHAENYDHTFYDVNENTEYIVKIVAEDYVGNISEKEVIVITHPYVARVVGKNNILWYTVDPDTKEIIPTRDFLMFDSIQSAIDYCANEECTIQTNPILPTVTENVTIGENQNITIDLDGRTITSDKNATIVNNGKLTIVDRNSRLNDQNEHDGIGYVLNTTNKAIINNGILVLGDGSAEASTSFVYPELDRPIIQGKNYAIEQNNMFYFYDGKLVANTLALIDNGEQPITQYSYNIIYTGENNKKIGSLDIITDPEARIKSTYYAKLKVNQGDNAFDSSKSGTISSESAEMLSRIRQYGDYGFIYDEINDLIYSGNSSTGNTTAISYLKLDLTKENEKQLLLFNAFADTYSSSSYGSVSISESYGNVGTEIYRLTGNDTTGTKIYMLEPGKVYYLYFKFVKAGGDINPNEKFEISNFKLLGEKEDTTDFKIYEDYSYSSFVKQTDGSIINNNIGATTSTAHSFIIYDLREQDKDLNIVITMDYKLNRHAKAWIYLSNSMAYQSPDSTTGRYAFFYDSNGATSGTNSKAIVTLKHGELNYLHFGFYNYYNYQYTDAYFKIKGINISEINPNYSIEVSPLMDNASDSYHFSVISTWDDLSINDNDGVMYGAKQNDEKTGVIFDGNDYVSLGQINNPEFTWESSFSIDKIKNTTIMANYENGGVGIKIKDGALYATAYIDSAYRDIVLTDNPEIGITYKVTFTWDGSIFKAYLNGTFVSSYEGTTYKNPDSNTIVMLGADPGGSTPTGSLFEGTIYTAKIYNRALSNEEISSGTTTNGLELYLSGSSKITPNSYISTNKGNSKTTSHSYLEFDLSNVNADKYLYVNTRISSWRYYDYGYVQLTESPDLPTNTTGRYISVSGSFDNQSAIIVLPKNTKSYLHFMYIKDGRRSENQDNFLIKEVTVYDTLQDAYSVNDEYYSSINNYTFEKPIVNDEVDTIEILKDITLNSTLVVPEEKEVILDLNGFTLTTNKDDYVIKNNGKLTIIDSDYVDKHAQNIDYKTEQARLYEEARERYLEDLSEYQEYSGTCENCEPSEEYILDNITSTDFSYKGEAEKFIVPYNGVYKIEAWGASGSNNSFGGKGAYTSGIITLDKNEELYIYVGKQSTGTGATFNGGGSCTSNCTAGGGATDIRLLNGNWNDASGLASRIMVAAGGGGYNPYSSGYAGGSGGKLVGINGAGDSPTTVATQTTGGISSGNVASRNGSFGKGGSGDKWGGGGAGGYYGGAGGKNSGTGNGGAGGSSYISGYKGSVAVLAEDSLSPRLDSNNTICTNTSALEDVKCSYHYSGKVFDETVMIAGNESMPKISDSGEMTGNFGDGHVRITLQSSEELDELREKLTRTYRVKEYPLFKDYISEIDFDTSIDVDSLTPDSDISYNNIVNDNMNGSITTTIANAVLNEENATLTLKGGNINVDANNKVGVVNRGILNVNDIAVINANNSGSYCVYNETNGDITSNGGILKASGSSSYGLLNRSNSSLISNLKVVTGSSNAIAIYNQSINDVIFNNLDISGSGLGFEEISTANTIITGSNIKSTNSYSLYVDSQHLPNKLSIYNSNLYGSLVVYASPKVVTVDKSTLTAVDNRHGTVVVNNSNLNSFTNWGQAKITGSTITNSGTAINNWSGTSNSWSGIMYDSNMVINNSTIKSTATSAVTVINNNKHLIVNDTEFININNVKSTVIDNTSEAYVTISGNTTVPSSFGTVVSNGGVVTIGTDDKNIQEIYEYSYTGKQEVFTAPADGLYKLETWGASGSPSSKYGGCATDTCVYRGGFGAYASGVIELHEGDKLYIHVGEIGMNGARSPSNSYYGTYNGGGINNNGDIMGWATRGSGGGATDISLSSEDNTWNYVNGASTSRRSSASYEQRLVVAGGGGVCTGSDYCYGGYDVDPSSSRLGYGNDGSGGGYYGGISYSGGSSYVSSSLTNIVMKKGNEEMPDYTSSGLIRGNYGSGYAKITQLNSEEAVISSNPSLAATDYGITGTGRTIYYDGVINAKVAINGDIDKVLDDYDIYKTIDANSNEKMILVANADSRPVEQGEEEFVAQIGDAKFTTIQKAIDASINGDKVDLLVNVEQQNIINIPSNKQITINYNGHTVKSYNSKYLYENHGNLTITDNTNTLGENSFFGDKYIYNDGILKISKLFINDIDYTSSLIENNGGVLTLESVKLTFDNSSGTNAVTNSADGTIITKNSTLNVSGNRNIFENNGSVTLEKNNISCNNCLKIVNNNSVGTAILDNNSYSVSGSDSYGRYFLYNQGTATIKNMITQTDDIYNSGILTLDSNDIPSGNISSSGLLIVNNGSYNNNFSISGTGKKIDDTDDLYSFIMHNGEFGKKLNISSSGIVNIESGSIIVGSGYAIDNSGAGIINLGIKDGNSLPKSQTRPIITGGSYGIYTSNPSLSVNFYDGVVSGQKAYNVTIEDIESGYSIYREYDSSNDIESKYLTTETMFVNVTQNKEYSTVEELNSAIASGFVNNNDVIKVYRNITLIKNTSSINIPIGLSLTFDINGKIIDKNNPNMFEINGELNVTDSVNDSEGIIDSTKGNIFTNNGILNISGGKFTSEADNTECTLILNNGTLNISNGVFTKYYDLIGYRQNNSGSIINNSGNASITGGKYYTNGTFVETYYRRVGSSTDYIYTSAVYVNTETGTLSVTGGEYDGYSGKTWYDYGGYYRNYSNDNKGELIYNNGIATFTGVNPKLSHIGRNYGTLTFNHITMSSIVSINKQDNGLGSHQNLINAGTLNIFDSEFTVYTAFLDNYGGIVNITNSTIDKISNGIAYRSASDDDWNGIKNSHTIRNHNYENGIINITNSFIYNKGSGEVFDNLAKLNITDSTINALNNNGINTSVAYVTIDDSDITTKGACVSASSGTVKITNESSLVSNSNQAIATSGATITLGELIEDDESVSQSYPLIKGNTYGVTNSNGTINFYDGILMGKTNPVSGVINNIEPGYMAIDEVNGDFKVNYLDRVPIVQNVTQATSLDEKKYYDLASAFANANDGDKLQMISNYSNLPDEITAVNNRNNIILDLNGKFIRQTNDLLITNNGVLTIIDSDENETGEIIAISGSKVIDNYGTLNITSGKISTGSISLLIKNNSGGSLTIRDKGKIVSSIITTLIDNDGTLNIYNGAYLQNQGGISNPVHITNTGLPMIINRDILNVIDYNSDDDENTSSEYSAPWLYSIGNGDVGKMFFWNVVSYNDSIIRNTSTGTVTMYGGIYNNGSTTSPDGGKIIYNSGVTTIKNLDSYSLLIGYNNGTLNISNSSFHNLQSGALVSNTGSLNVYNTTLDLSALNYSKTYNGNNVTIQVGNATFDTVTFSGGLYTNSSYPINLIDVQGNTLIKNSSIDVYAQTGVISNNSTLTIKNTPVSVDKTISNSGTLNIDSSNITSSVSGISNSGTFNLINGSTITANVDGISTSSGTVNIQNGTSVMATNGSGISISGGTLNLGEIGGTPDSTTPYIQGSTYGVYRSSQSSRFNFYDGLVVGKMAPNAVYGGVSSFEGGYEPTNIIETNPDNPDDKTYKEYLVVSATSVAIAKVGESKFTTNSQTSAGQALQTAIDHATVNPDNIKDVELLAHVNLVTDEVIVTSQYPVTINYNGFEIDEDTNYYLGSNIYKNRNNNNLGSNVSKLLSDVFDISNITKDIIIYEMNDGSNLDTTKIYKLYKDNNIISLKKEELGKYKYKGNTEKLIPIKGRLYIDNLSKGSYRLESSDNKYIEFSIDEDGNISGNIAENSKDSSSTSALSNSEAELILNIQTGITKTYYFLLIMPIVLIIILLIILLRKNRKREI